MAKMERNEKKKGAGDERKKTMSLLLLLLPMIRQEQVAVVDPNIDGNENGSAERIRRSESGDGTRTRRSDIGMILLRRVLPRRIDDTSANGKRRNERMMTKMMRKIAELLVAVSLPARKSRCTLKKQKKIWNKKKLERICCNS
jgi:hypothetical protein